MDLKQTSLSNVRHSPSLLLYMYVMPNAFLKDIWIQSTVCVHLYPNQTKQHPPIWKILIMSG